MRPTTITVNDTEQAIKELIIEALNLEDMSPDDIETEAPLFGDGLGLDSIDALELGVAIRRKYGVNLDIDFPLANPSISTLLRVNLQNGETNAHINYRYGVIVIRACITVSGFRFLSIGPSTRIYLPGLQAQ